MWEPSCTTMLEPFWIHMRTLRGGSGAVRAKSAGSKSVCGFCSVQPFLAPRVSSVLKARCGNSLVSKAVRSPCNWLSPGDPMPSGICHRPWSRVCVEPVLRSCTFSLLLWMEESVVVVMYFKATRSRTTQPSSFSLAQSMSSRVSCRSGTGRISRWALLLVVRWLLPSSWAGALASASVSARCLAAARRAVVCAAIRVCRCRHHP
jgi:hypothetical protein